MILRPEEYQHLLDKIRALENAAKDAIDWIEERSGSGLEESEVLAGLREAVAK